MNLKFKTARQVGAFEPTLRKRGVLGKSEQKFLRIRELKENKNTETHSHHQRIQHIRTGARRKQGKISYENTSSSDCKISELKKSILSTSRHGFQEEIQCRCAP